MREIGDHFRQVDIFLGDEKIKAGLVIHVESWMDEIDINIEAHDKITLWARIKGYAYDELDWEFV